MSECNVSDLVINETRRLGLLLPGCKKASSVITAYLDKAISDQKLLQARDGSEETERRSHTLLGSLLAQKVPEKVHYALRTKSSDKTWIQADTYVTAHQRPNDGDPYRRKGKASEPIAYTF